MRIWRAAIAVLFSLVVLGSTAAPAQADAVGGFTDVTSTFQPGSDITVESTCFNLADADFQFVTLTAGDQYVAHYSTYDSPTITLTIPADVPIGTGLTLRGTCSDYINQQDQQYVTLESYGPVYIVVGQGIVAELPSFGRSSTDLALIAGVLVVAGAAMVIAPRRRTV